MNNNNIQLSRNYGVDLLRIVSMIMIPILHILGHGGIIEAAAPLSIPYELAYLLELAAYCATDCYALISGYVGFSSKFKYSRILLLYLQVIFYTVITTIAGCIINPTYLTAKNVFYAFFPIGNNTYWYFTAYFCMFFFIPFLNMAVEKAPREVLKKLIVSFIVVLSLLPEIFRYDIATIANGYSPIWLCVLYIIGAYIKKYDVGASLKNSKKLLCYAVCVVLTWLIKFAADFFNRGGKPLEISYTSITIIICAVSLLLFFSKLELGKGTVGFVKFFAPVSFGVYLIHEAPVVRAIFITDRFIGYLKLNPLLMIAAVIATALAIWLVCSLVDRVRLWLFKLLNLRRLCEKTEEKIKAVSLKLIKGIAK